LILAGSLSLPEALDPNEKLQETGEQPLPAAVACSAASAIVSSNRLTVHSFLMKLVAGHGKS
jgi:hypothetical protein